MMGMMGIMGVMDVMGLVSVILIVARQIHRHNEIVTISEIEVTAGVRHVKARKTTTQQHTITK